jgi:hypothetical protein
MLLAAVEAEVGDYIERHEHECDEDGRRLVVRDGKAKARTVTTGARTIEVEICQRGCVRGLLQCGARFVAQLSPGMHWRRRRREVDSSLGRPEQRRVRCKDHALGCPHPATAQPTRTGAALVL